MSRRRLLLALVDQYKWLPYAMENLFNSPIPKSIDGKQVYNKAKLGTIYGNSVVENQLINLTNGTSSLNGTTLVINNGVATLTGTCTGSANFEQIASSVNVISAHKYLICNGVQNMPISNKEIANLQLYSLDPFVSFTIYENSTTNCKIVSSNNNATCNWRIRVEQGETYNLVMKPLFVDLTQMFGADNEPTTTDDPRIQAIIKQGYIPFNEGTLQSTNISKLTHKKLPDEFQEVEYLESTGTQYIDSGVPVSSDIGFELRNDFDGLSFEATKTRNGGRNTSYLTDRQALSLISTAESKFRLDIGNNQFEMEAKTLRSIYFDNINRYAKATFFDMSIYEIQNINVGVFFAEVNFYLFTLITAEPLSYSYATSQKLTNAKFWSNGVLIRNFIPCYRKSDNVAGLYDLVNDVFYTNAGTGDFVVGNDVQADELNLPTAMQLKGAMSAHNTFEVTFDSYVFTRNVGSAIYDGSENKGIDILKGNNGVFRNLGSYTQFYLQFAQIADCEQYSESNYTRHAISNISVNSSSVATVGVSINNNQGVKWVLITLPTTTASTAEQANAWLRNNNVAVQYQLATSQIITIPKKHLGYYTALTDLSIGDTITLTDYKGNMYCDYGDIGTIENNTLTLTMAIPQGTSIFYETNNEITDFINLLDITDGGYLSSDSQVLPNVTMKYKCRG